MADTIGDLIDKLTIANVRLWHIEDERREFTEQGGEIPPDNLREGYERSQELLRMVANVNKERNSLIDQINAGLKVLLDAANAHGDSHFAIKAEDLLGTGKNKFYKREDC